MSQEKPGPLVRVTLPDGQTVNAVMHLRVQEEDRTWWCVVELPLYDKVERARKYTAEPAPVVFDAPTTVCEPIPGQDYAGVPTERRWEPPRWVIEQRGLTLETGPQLVVHRARCRAGGRRRTRVYWAQARTAVEQDGAEACGVCHPETTLGQ
ncbi:DUF6233 domain-containing protein [Streptomyces sp. NPDC051976]|uniref:DUF6233 domain-containing protein n=1 Tax=Streptomyces sp. NPDC051976 TaxID=3154947 RepID=UPI0034237E15